MRAAAQSGPAAAWVYASPKGTARRVITLPPPLIAVLRQHRIKQTAERALVGELWQEHNLVFSQPTGWPIDPRRDWDD
ncbi:MAG: hypothetical protein ACRDUV_22575 [Pseudonocardiaceae bacterium]